MDIHPTAKYKRVEFPINTNNKILCNVFLMFTPLHKIFSLSETCDIRIANQHNCYAKVVRTKTMLLKEIMDAGLHLTESGICNDDFFMHTMEAKYSKKTWWANGDTIFQVVHFEKIQQISIFEDGLYPMNNDN